MILILEMENRKKHFLTVLEKENFCLSLFQHDSSEKSFCKKLALDIQYLTIVIEIHSKPCIRFIFST